MQLCRHEGLISQLWAPLQFLGFYIRRGRMSYVNLFRVIWGKMAKLLQIGVEWQMPFVQVSEGWLQITFQECLDTSRSQKTSKEDDLYQVIQSDLFIP